SIRAWGTGLSSTAPSIVRSNRIAPSTLSPVKAGEVMMRQRIRWIRSNISESSAQLPGATPYPASALGVEPPDWSSAAMKPSASRMRRDISWWSIFCSPELPVRVIRARSFYSGWWCWQSVAGAFARAAGARGGPAWTMAPSTPTPPSPSKGRGIAYEANLSLLVILNLFQDPSPPTRGAFGQQNPPKLARPRGEVAPRPEAPSRAAKWALKQVQGDEFGGAGAHCDPPALKGRLALRSKANGV